MVGVLTGIKTEMNLFRIFQGRLRLHGISAGSRDDFESMNAFLAHHKVRPLVDRAFGLESVQEAMRYMEQGKHFGKVVVRLPAAGASAAKL